MGNYGLFLALAGIVIISALSLNTRKSTEGANEGLAQNVYKTVAREASMTGINMTVRNLVAVETSWRDSLMTNPDAFSYKGVEYDNSTTFTTTVFSESRGYPEGTPNGRCSIDMVDVVSVGYAAPYGIKTKEHEQTRRTSTHRIEATYERTCSDVAGGAREFDFVTLADDNFNFEGKIDIFSADPSLNADVHSNKRINVKDEASVEGFGTQVRSSGGCASGCRDVFDPNSNPGGEPAFESGVERIDVPLLVREDWEPLATHYSSGKVKIGNVDSWSFADPSERFNFNEGGISITGSGSFGTEERPAVWFIDGDLEINADVIFEGYLQIFTTGGVKIDSDAQLTMGVPAGTPHPPTYESNPDSRDKAAVQQWFDDYLPERKTNAGIYAAGCYDGDCSSNPGIHLNGKSTVVGQLYTNYDLTINGEASIYGALVSGGYMGYNGDPAVWYTGANVAIQPGGGSALALPDGIRLIAWVEF